MACAWPWFTSVREPNRPCPYSDTRAGGPVSAERGMLHVKRACVTLPGIGDGGPLVFVGSNANRAPDGHSGRSR